MNRSRGRVTNCHLSLLSPWMFFGDSRSTDYVKTYEKKHSFCCMLQTTGVTVVTLRHLVTAPSRMMREDGRACAPVLYDARHREP
jgi:hypothetical protein